MGLLICKYDLFLTISQCRVSDTQVTIKAYGPLGFSNFSASGIDFLGGGVTNCPWLVHKPLWKKTSINRSNLPMILCLDFILIWMYDTWNNAQQSKQQIFSFLSKHRTYSIYAPFSFLKSIFLHVQIIYQNCVCCVVFSFPQNMTLQKRVWPSNPEV